MSSADVDRLLIHTGMLSVPVNLTYLSSTDRQLVSNREDVSCLIYSTMLNTDGNACSHFKELSVVPAWLWPITEIRMGILDWRSDGGADNVSV